MKFLPVAVVYAEGDLYRPQRDPTAPIRIYPDRWVEDDIAAAWLNVARRERLSRQEYKLVRRYARQNGKGV